MNSYHASTFASWLNPSLNHNLIIMVPIMVHIKNMNIGSLNGQIIYRLWQCKCDKLTWNQSQIIENAGTMGIDCTAWLHSNWWLSHLTSHTEITFIAETSPPPSNKQHFQIFWESCYDWQAWPSLTFGVWTWFAPGNEWYFTGSAWICYSGINVTRVAHTWRSQTRYQRHERENKVSAMNVSGCLNGSRNLMKSAYNR